MSDLIYDLTLDDREKFSLHFLKHSDTGRSEIRKFRLTAAATIALALVALTLWERWVNDAFSRNLLALNIAVGVVLILGLWVAAPFFRSFSIKRGLNKARKKGEFGQSDHIILSIKKSGIGVKTNLDKVSVSWDELKKVIETDTYVYVFVSEGTAIIIPKRIGEDKVSTFVDSVLSHSPDSLVYTSSKETSE